MKGVRQPGGILLFVDIYAVKLDLPSVAGRRRRPGL
jgi:hypothetical protein